MSKWTKLIDKILRGQQDANIPFDDLCQLLIRLGFVPRTRGSHHVFRKPGIPEFANLQSQGPQAKPYQVRQVRDLILRYGHGEPDA